MKGVSNKKNHKKKQKTNFLTVGFMWMMLLCSLGPVATDAVTPDVVTVTKAEYKADKDEFKVEATSSDQPSVTLTVVGYGAMTWKNNKYEYKAKGDDNPGPTVTVTSSGGGQDTSNVSQR